MWEAAFTSLRLEIESGFDMLKGGKAIHQPMRLPEKGETLTGLGIRNKVGVGGGGGGGIGAVRTRSNESVPARSPRPDRYHLPPPAEESPQLQAPPPINLSSKPSMGSLNASKPRYGGSSPNLSPHIGPDTRRPSYGSSTNGHDDYFGRPRIPSSSATSAGAMSPLVVGKKKPPPPPPPKKIGSFHGEYVTAMYDFEAHSHGDLSFREGDRIRVVKKTNSSQDWWEGEIGGKKGSFPANYVK